MEDLDPVAPAPAGKSHLEAQERTFFVGREDELALLQGAIKESQDAATAAVIQGELGIGKSTLVKHLVDSLVPEQKPIVVLRGRSYPGDLMPYRAFDGVVDGLRQHLDTLSPERLEQVLPVNHTYLSLLFPQLATFGEQAVEERGNVSAQRLRHQMFAAFQDLLERLSSYYQLVLSLDDFQWADASSRALLLALLHTATYKSADAG